MKKRVLVIGCGSIGERHLRCLLRTGGAQVVACDSKEFLLERMRKEYAVATFVSLEAALASQKFEGVVICTPAHTHIAIALKAIRTGAGLLIEKPLSVGFDQLDELQKEIAKTKRFVGVAYIYHFTPSVEAARGFLQNADFGRPLQVNIVSGQHFPTFRPAYREIYYTRHETGGGAIQDALTHFVNLVEWFFGPTTRVVCDSKHQALEGISVEDTVNAMATNGGVLVSYSLNQFQAPNETLIQIHCERGSVKIEPHAQRWAVFPRDATDWEYRSVPVKHRDDLFLAQANAFLEGLDGKRTVLCTLDEAVQTLKFNVAALESARTGQAVTIA